MKQKKEKAVVYIITKLELGGAQKICLSLFDDLQTHTDFDGFLISGTEGKLAPEVASHPRVYLLDALQREVSGFGLLQEVAALYALVRVLRSIKKQYHTVIVHTHSTKAGVYGRLAAWLTRIPLRIHTIHGYGFHTHQGWFSWLVLFSLEWLASLITTHFVCVSSYDADFGKRYFPRFAKKFSMIRAAVALNTIVPAHKMTRTEFKGTTTVFGTIACFKPQKNLFDLLQAFEMVHRTLPTTRLEIVGDGVQRPAIERWIRQHGLSEVITLHGWQDNVAPFLATWHAFVLSSLWEGLPCVIIEARLHKLPVICYDTGGIKDVIIHGKNGLLCEQKDWRALAANMLSVTQNGTILKSLGLFNDNLQDFEQQSMTLQHRQLYTRLIQK